MGGAVRDRGPRAVPVRVGRVDSLHELYPKKKMWFATATSNDRLIASEPFSDLPGVWQEIDESSAVIVRSGGVLEHEPFRPRVPRATLSS